MKIASSSASFTRMLASGEVTQLEWLDLCAAELELDGVVFDTRHFARRDPDYLAQLKKTAVDLGLTVAALAAFDLTAPPEVTLDDALALGAPLVIVDAPPRSDGPAAWNDFAATLKPLVSAGKSRNVTIALRNGPSTLCAGAVECKRIAKDIDSAWLRFATDATTLGALDKLEDLAAKTVIATHAIDDVEAFALAGDAWARRLIDSLHSFRGFVLLDRSNEDGERDAFHRSIGRFRALLAQSEQSVVV